MDLRNYYAVWKVTKGFSIGGAFSSLVSRRQSYSLERKEFRLVYRTEAVSKDCRPGVISDISKSAYPTETWRFYNSPEPWKAYPIIR